MIRDLLCFFRIHIDKGRNIYDTPPHDWFIYCLNCHKHWKLTTPREGDTHE